MNSKSKILLVAASALLVAGSASANVSNVVLSTEANIGNTGDNQRALVSFDFGGETYTSFSIATFDSGLVSTGLYAGGGGASNGNATDVENYNDILITTGAFATGEVEFSFGMTLNDGDTNPIYITEHLGNDSFTVNPIVGGTVDLNWFYVVDLGDWTTVTSANNPRINGSPTETIAVTAFTLADFSGGTGTLTNVTGIRFGFDSIEGNGVDVSQVGVVDIPEPSDFALLAGVLGLGIAMVRRRS